MYMIDEICDVLLEHLKSLKGFAEEAEDENLGIITSAMVNTANAIVTIKASES